VRVSAAIALLFHGCWSLFALTKLFKPRPEWAPLRKRLVVLDALLSGSSFWAAAELLTGRSARLPAAALGILVLLLIPLPCYFDAVNRHPGMLRARNVAFASLVAILMAFAAGLLAV